MLTEILTQITEAMCRGCFLEPAGFIAPECCGINGVQAMIILFAVLGLTSRLSFLRLAVLMAVTFVAAIAQNFVRVLILILTKDLISADAWNILHQVIGYVTALLAIVFVLNFFTKINNKKRTTKK